MQQASVERKAMNSWMFMRPLKRKELQVTEGEADVLFGRAVQILQELMESEHAEHRLQAAEITSSSEEAQIPGVFLNNHKRRLILTE
ncbi:hypothetical protein ABN764_27745 [Paenibacillaceae sp. P-4]|uniref:hypothetical protein n=1 Tax=Paenibacillaceae bacterium P-4 TaxID=3160969 RepID=UPI0032E80C76